MMILTAFLAGSCGGPPVPGPNPQLILHGGRIYTQAEPQRIVEAIALQDGRVLAIGADEEILPLASERTRVLDLNGRPVYPGFADGHAHLVGVGAYLDGLSLMGTGSLEEVVERVAERHRSLPAGEWLIGRGWDQNDWPVKAFPNHAVLSEVAPARPIALIRVDGHAWWLNAAAMEAAGIDRLTPDPVGGRLLRDAEGNPTGVVIDNGIDPVREAMPARSLEATARAIGLATTAFHAQGITAVHDAGVGADTLALLEAMSSEGRLQLRLHEMLSSEETALLQRRFQQGPVADHGGNGTLAVRAVKIYADGALGSRGAHLLEDYSDAHGETGLTVTLSEDRLPLMKQAQAAGFQVATHAIGDAGNRTVLEDYAEVFARAGLEQGAQQAQRWRIEHAQVVAPEDFRRFAELGVIPAMQAQHQVSDMDWAEARLGPERVKGAYAWRRFLEAGCIIAGGSDAPVEALDVVAQWIAAVARTDRAGLPVGGWHVDQALDRQEALNMLTTWPAFAAFREADLGRLLPGYRADLVVYSGDLMRLPLEELAQCQPVLTVFAGEIVWMDAQDG